MKVVTISRWLNFGRPAPRERGLQRGENFWLRLTTVSAQCLSLSERFFIYTIMLLQISTVRMPNNLYCFYFPNDSVRSQTGSIISGTQISISFSSTPMVCLLPHLKWGRWHPLKAHARLWHYLLVGHRSAACITSSFWLSPHVSAAASTYARKFSVNDFNFAHLTLKLLPSYPVSQQEAQLMLTTGSTRLAVNQGQQT